MRKNLFILFMAKETDNNIDFQVDKTDRLKDISFLLNNKRIQNVFDLIKQLDEEEDRNKKNIRYIVSPSSSDANY